MKRIVFFFLLSQGVASGNQAAGLIDICKNCSHSILEEEPCLVHRNGTGRNTYHVACAPKCYQSPASQHTSVKKSCTNKNIMRKKGIAYSVWQLLRCGESE